MNPSLEKLVTARVAALMKFPFFGNLATRLYLKEDNTWCKTAATDGRNMYYNAEFVSGLTDRQAVFVIGHELLHVVFDHVGTNSRGVGYDAKLANIAADFAVNSTLVKESFGEPIGRFIDKDTLLNPKNQSIGIGTLYDPRYDEWSFEQIYDDLIQDPRSEEFKSKDIQVCFDQHLDGSGNNGEPELDESEIRQIQNEIREAILTAAEAAGIGSVPGNIRRLIGSLTEPKMDWREILDATIESQVKSDYSYMKLGRRSFSSNIVFPSMKREPSIQATLALDMSGSITDEDIKDFFSEVYGIVCQHSSYEIGIMCWDTTVYNYQVFTEDDGDKILEYRPEGGGGTDLRCVYEYMKDEDIHPTQLVVFTDGEIYNWGDEDYCPTLFIIKNKYRKVSAPYGETTEYK